jgi:hypothetical protein
VISIYGLKFCRDVRKMPVLHDECFLAADGFEVMSALDRDFLVDEFHQFMAFHALESAAVDARKGDMGGRGRCESTLPADCDHFI